MVEQRLIDVNPLVSGMKGRLKRYEKEYGYLSDFVSGYEEAIDDVVDTPIVEAKPVVHAHWEEVREGRHICSNCKVVCLCKNEISSFWKIKRSCNTLLSLIKEVFSLDRIDTFSV